MSTDSSFFTNESGSTLKDRFGELVKDSELFDCLVGYFYSSGFHAVYPSLESTDKIRILIGISTSKETFKMMEEGNTPNQRELISHNETKKEIEEQILYEMETSEDNKNVETGVHKFIEWIRSNKLTIRAVLAINPNILYL